MSEQSLSGVKLSQRAARCLQSQRRKRTRRLLDKAYQEFLNNLNNARTESDSFSNNSNDNNDNITPANSLRQSLNVSRTEIERVPSVFSHIEVNSLHSNLTLRASSSSLLDIFIWRWPPSTSLTREFYDVEHRIYWRNIFFSFKILLWLWSSQESGLSN